MKLMNSEEVTPVYRRYYNPYNGYPRQTKNSENPMDSKQDDDKIGPENQARKIKTTPKETEHVHNASVTTEETNIKNEPEIIIPIRPATNPQQISISSFLSDKLSFLGKLKTDDIILIALVLLFLLDGIEDEGILIVLIALFIVGR